MARRPRREEEQRIARRRVAVDGDGVERGLDRRRKQRLQHAGRQRGNRRDEGKHGGHVRGDQPAPLAIPLRVTLAPSIVVVRDSAFGNGSVVMIALASVEPAIGRVSRAKTLEQMLRTSPDRAVRRSRRWSEENVPGGAPAAAAAPRREPRGLASLPPVEGVGVARVHHEDARPAALLGSVGGRNRPVPKDRASA